MPVYQREEVRRVAFDALLQQDSAAMAQGIRLYVWHAESAHQGETLGAKLNRALQSLRGNLLNTQSPPREMYSNPFDYCMVLGSDDLLRPQIWGYIRTAIDEGLQFFGFNECAIYDRINHRAKIWNYGPATIGAGRCISRKLVEACGWELWGSAKNNGIDNSMDAIVMRKAGAFASIIPTLRPVICDIKDGDNLNSFDQVPGIEANVERIRRDFPALEAWPLPAKNSELWVTTTTAGAV